MTSKTIIDGNDLDAVLPEFREAKLALARVLYLGAMLDRGFLVPKQGEIIKAAVAANERLHCIETMLGLDAAEVAS